MAMRTATPWWASLLFGIGLFLLFIGERILGHLPGARMVATGLGAVLVIGVTAVRAYAMLASRDARRRVERTLLVSHLGSLLALLLYALTTPTGMKLLGQASLTGKSLTHYSGAMTVLWMVALIASIIPLAMIEFSLGTARRERFDLARSADAELEGVEYLRVREIGWSGLTVALAIALGMVTCRVAEERNVSKDVSYFKTSAPGDSTINIAKSLSEPLKVLLFFPSANEVKDEVRTYFSSLRAATGKVQIEEYDRYVSADLAAKYRVNKDGVIVLLRGEKSETLEVDTDFKRARTSKRASNTLRTLDREVNTRLLKLVRDRRKAYLAVGHGEINDPNSIDPSFTGKVRPRQTQVFRKRLSDLGYDTKNLGLIDLARDVPSDATVVIVLGPTQPLQAAELASLDRYLAKGGRILFALDPQAEATLGQLEGRLGVRFERASITDDRSFLPQRGSPADRRFALTTQFSSHASTTTLSRTIEAGLPLVDSGALFDADFAAAGGAEKPKKTFVIRSMESAWLDRNNNYTFDEKAAEGEAAEKRDRYNVAAAVEGAKTKGADGKETDGFRALVYADVDLFADAVVDAGFGQRALVMIGGPILEDAVRWLGGEEVFAGEVITEDDKPIKHSKSQDNVWFLLIIVGLPLLVLGLGLTATRRRRKKPALATREVTP
ncbi:MAG: Gldg family protein [Myxococcales bacterium]|nr:Gldg family protein [Myxococcales bacterium]